MASRDTKTSRHAVALPSYTLDVGSNTFTVAADGYNQLGIYYQLTRAAATKLTFAITEDPGDGVDYGLLEETVAAGVVTLDARTYERTVGASENKCFGVPVTGTGNVKVVITDTDGTGSDSLIVTTKLSVL